MTQEEQIKEAIEWMKMMKSNRNLDLESKEKAEKSLGEKRQSEDHSKFCPRNS